MTVQPSLTRRVLVVIASATAVAGTLLPAAPAHAAPTQDVPPNLTPGVCDEYAGDPDFGTPPGSVEWHARDAHNVACSYQRHEDAQASPAFLAKDQEQVAVEELEFATVTAPEWAAEPNRQHANCCSNPQSKVGDPFRSPEEWAAAGRGRHTKFYLMNNLGAKLRARLFAPLDTEGRYPAVTFTPGLQSYNEVNSWFPEELAEAGYVVLIIDPQGQGDSENCGHAPDGTQTDCPTTHQPDDTRSAIDFILSTPSNLYQYNNGDDSPNADGTPTFNPYWESIDPERVGIAGHSLGAIAVTPIGQEDDRVDAVISFDNLDGTLGDAVPRRTPSLYFYTDYAFPATGAPKASPPDPNQHMGAFNQLKTANVDTMSITTRASDHYEWGYQPYPANFPSSRYGERAAVHYSLAWFDRYLKGDATATERLTTHYFDDTADEHSIGAGTYDPAKAAADPTNPFAGNAPYLIAGKCVANLMSIYHATAYFLEAGAQQSADVRARGCPSAAGEFHPLTPARLLDTRSSSSPLGPGTERMLQVTGAGGVPAAGVSAVVVNVTATAPTANSFVTIFPQGSPRPLASNLNTAPGVTRPNLVTVKVGAGGGIVLYNDAGSVHLIVDVVGYYVTETGAAGSRYHSVRPERLMDTRNFGDPNAGVIGDGGVKSLDVTTGATVPEDASGVVLNVTVTQPTEPSFLTAYPGDVGLPLASNLNYVAGAEVPNLVTVRLPAGGGIKVYNDAGFAHVIVDLVGYYDGDKSTEAGRYVARDPERYFDTRLDAAGPLAPGEAKGVEFADDNPIPVDAVAVLLNVTVTQPTGTGYLTAFPWDEALPLASNLNFRPGQTAPNLVIVRLSVAAASGLDAGAAGFFNSAGFTHVLGDVGGFFTGASGSGAVGTGSGASASGGGGHQTQRR